MFTFQQSASNTFGIRTDVSLFLDNEVITKDKETLREKGLYERTMEKGHGRIETREYFIWSETDWLFGAERWAGLSGIGVIVSESTGEMSIPKTTDFIVPRDDFSAKANS